MTNLMKVSLGQEPGETPELAHSLGDEETSPLASTTTTSARPPLPVVVLGGTTTSAELPAEVVVETRALLSSQTMLSPRSPCGPAAVPTGASAPADPDVGKEDGSSSSNNNQVNEENEDGGSSSARRGSTAGGEGRDSRKERRHSTARRREEEEPSQRKRERSRRDKKLPPLISDRDRDRDYKPSSPSRPPTTRPPHPSAAWLEADHDGDRSRQRRAEESSSASRRLSTNSIRPDGRQPDSSRSLRPAKTASSGKSAYHTLTGKTHYGSSSSSSASKEREKRPTGSSRSQIVKGSGRPAGPGSRSGEARDGSGGDDNGSRSSEVRATEALVRKRTRSNSFDEATIKRFVGAAKLENNSSGTPAGSALTKTSVVSSPRRRPLRRSTSANNPTASDTASPRTDDDDDDESTDDLSGEVEEDSRRRDPRAERKSSTVMDRRGSKAGLRG
jgi:hypothetical protein